MFWISAILGFELIFLPPVHYSVFWWTVLIQLRKSIHDIKRREIVNWTCDKNYKEERNNIIIRKVLLGAQNIQTESRNAIWCYKYDLLLMIRISFLHPISTFHELLFSGIKSSEQHIGIIYKSLQRHWLLNSATSYKWHSYHKSFKYLSLQVLIIKATGVNIKKIKTKTMLLTKIILFTWVQKPYRTQNLSVHRHFKTFCLSQTYKQKAEMPSDAISMIYCSWFELVSCIQYQHFMSCFFQVSNHQSNILE